MKGKNIILSLCVMMCMLFVVQNIHADSTDGTAYAVLTDEGELILFRSENNYSAVDNTVTDINGNSYTGHVYTGIETTNYNDYRNAKWYDQRSSIKSVRVANGQTIKPKNCGYWFYNCSNCTSMDLAGLDTGNVTRMDDMFYWCSGLTSLDITFNTANVTNMIEMFRGCSGLTSLDIGNFNTGNVTSMQYMFQSCSKLTSLDLSGFNTANVTIMSYMFEGCRRLTSLDLSSFNTANVTNMREMFCNCSGLTSLNVGGFNTGNVTNMTSMFNGCSGLTSLDLISFDTAKVTDMSYMFSYCNGLTNLDLRNFNTAKVTNMRDMFAGCSGLTNLDLSNFNTGNVTTMEQMFYGCSGLTSLDLSSFNTANVTNMGEMFTNCSGLTSLNLSSFNTANVTNMNRMFDGCSGLASFDLSNFNTENVKYMNSMFYGCSGLTSLNISSFNTEKVTNMGYMFQSCSGLTALNLSNFNTGNVTTMGAMFFGCSGLTSLDLSSFNTANVTIMSSMFYNCNKLSSVILGQNFGFKGKNIISTSNQAILPTPPTSVTRGTVNYTQKWIRDDEVYGPYTPNELRDNYDGTRMSGTWVWEEVPTKYKVVYLPPDETYSGSMPIQKLQPDGDAVLNKCTFYKFDEHLSYWQGNDSRTYTDEGTIPANRFHVGDILTLTAVFEPNDHHLRQTDGIATLTMHGGEKITLPDLKGGVTYQVWEDMPSGWQQVSQTNPAGKIMANETIDSSFTNKYVPSTATITLMAQKTLDGRMPEDDAFEFILSSTTGPVETVTNKAGMVTFAPLTFQTPGTYIYTISEVRGNNDGINYDPHTETITINVTDDENGNLTATTNQSELPVFENMTKPGTLTITKDTNIVTDETFTFEIVFENEYGQPLDEITVLKDIA